MRRLAISLCLLLACLVHILRVDARSDENSLWRGLAKLMVESIKLIEPERGGGARASPRGKLLDTVLPKDCGLLYEMERISGGYEAKLGEFPSYVRLDIVKRNPDGSNWTSLCGGTLISDEYIVTAAHCLQDDTIGVVVATTLFAQKTFHGEAPQMKHAVASRCVSSKFNASLKTYESSHDVALLKLWRRVKFGRFLQPACLPREPSAGKRNLKAVGLGASHYQTDLTGQFIGRPTFPNRLLALPVEVAECVDARDKHYTKVCINSTGTQNMGNTCPGDSGGPIYGMENGRQVLVSSVSYGNRSCVAGKRGQSVNTDIYNLRDELELLMERCKV